MADPEGVQGARSNPSLRQNYSILMENFQKIQKKIANNKFRKFSQKNANNKVQSTNRTPFVNLNPLLRNPGSAPADTYLL